VEIPNNYPGNLHEGRQNKRFAGGIRRREGLPAVAVQPDRAPESEKPDHASISRKIKFRIQKAWRLLQSRQDAYETAFRGNATAENRMGAGYYPGRQRSSS